MKQMQEIGVPADFSFNVPDQAETGMVNSWLSRQKKRFVQLIDNRRELIVTGAATLTIGLVFLLISYLFFIQLAAYGW